MCEPSHVIHVRPFRKRFWEVFERPGVEGLSALKVSNARGTVAILKNLATFLAVVAALVFPGAGHGGAVVTLTSPTEKPTLVQGGGSLAPAQTFTSSDITPFDQNASSGGAEPGFRSAGGNSHLTLNVGASEIRSTFDGGCGAHGGDIYSALGTYSARFSLDITVDTLTAFSFEAQTSVNGSGNFQGNVVYRFYTPTSNQLNVSFGTATGIPWGGSVSGVLLPGETYRFEFTGVGQASAGGSVWDSTARGNSSAVLVIPEPASVALLFAGVVICLGRRRISRGIFLVTH